MYNKTKGKDDLGVRAGGTPPKTYRQPFYYVLLFPCTFSFLPLPFDLCIFGVLAGLYLFQLHHKFAEFILSLVVLSLCISQVLA